MTFPLSGLSGKNIDRDVQRQGRLGNVLRQGVPESDPGLALSELGRELASTPASREGDGPGAD